MKWIGVVCNVLLLLAVNAVALASGTPNVTNFVASGNLQSTHDIGCAKSSKITSRYSPADLYRGLAVCVTNDNFKDGAFLFALAGVYGRFDALRVSDTSAHQAVGVLKMQTLGSVDTAKREALSSEVKKMVGDSENLRITCNKIKKIGAPTYHPVYMIQHGMKAFTGAATNRGLVVDFDSRAAWESALESYLHCPKN